MPIHSKPLRPSKKSPRGFVLLVILGIVALLTGVTLSQLNRSGRSRVAASRSSHQAMARAIAEQCVQRAVRYARAEANDPAAEDLDRLLDPQPGSSGDEFIPDVSLVGGSVVYVPASVGASGDTLLQNHHRFAFVPEGTGACLIRYDDNGDDLLTAGSGLSARTWGSIAIEGPGLTVDVPTRDIDRAIIVTAVGIHPYAAASDPLTAYERAKSRITKRGFLQTEIMSSGNKPALHLTNNLFLDGPAGGPNRFKVCGSGRAKVGGGITGPDDNKQCACGETNVGSGPEKFNDCGGTCSSGCVAQFDGPMSAVPAVPPVDAGTGRLSVATGDGPTDYGAAGSIPNTPSLTSIMSVANFGGSMGSAGCKYFLDEFPDAAHPSALPVVTVETSPTIYVWDKGDSDPDGTVTSAYGRSWRVVDASGGLITPPSTWLNHDCTTYSFPTVGRPCKWDATTNNVECTLNETLCWKPVAVLDGATGTTPSISAAGTESTEDTHLTSAGVRETFQPRNGANVPFAAPSTFGPPQTWDGLCGPRTGTAGDNHRGWRHDGTSFRFGDTADPVNGDEWTQQGSYFIIDSLNRTYMAESIGSENQPLKASFYTSGGIEFDAHVDLCCPTCDCTWGPGPGYTRSQCTYETALNSVPAGGAALIAGDRCRFEKGVSNPDYDVVGNVTCRTVHIDDAGNNSCFLGTLIGTNDDYDCAATTDITGCGTTTGICIEDNTVVAGSLVTRGQICLEEDIRVDAGYGTGIAPGGIVYSGRGLYIEDDTTIAAPVYVNGTARMEEDVRVIGRLVADELRVRDHGVMIDYAGDAIPTLVVLEDTKWVETTW